MTLRPIGYFVHHQGRGHAERCAALAAALPRHRPVTIFCARDDIFPSLGGNARICLIPSLFERRGDEAGDMDWIATPDTLHCAPLGWPGIRKAMAVLAEWFDSADPALMICDVSAEVAQFARICSVPHVKILQHGDRSDAGHMAAYRGAAGLLAPFAPELAQDDWPGWMRDKIHYAPGIGIAGDMPTRAEARARLDLDPKRAVIVVVSGAGGNGFAQAPLGVAARSRPDTLFLTIGEVQRDWHATEPANLSHRGWVDNAADYIAAADLVISSTGNTTCQQILTAGKPWLAVPEWRYFDEQAAKAQCLDRAGVALCRPHLPSSAHDWQAVLNQVIQRHDPARQAALVPQGSSQRAADWIEALIARLWPKDTPTPHEGEADDAVLATLRLRADACAGAR